MAKPNLQNLLNSAKGETSQPAGKPSNVSPTAEVAPAAPRQIHKPGEVNISAYFPADVKSGLRMVQAKTGNNVKECLAEALRDLFRKYNVPVSAALGEDR